LWTIPFIPSNANPYKELDDSDSTTAMEDSDGHATEDSDDHTATAYKLSNANLSQLITTTNKLFNANPFKRITKETDKYFTGGHQSQKATK
jgi:hypothetical protein